MKACKGKIDRLHGIIVGPSLSTEPPCLEVEKKCNEKGTFFFFTNWWKHAMMSLLYMPVELYVLL